MKAWILNKWWKKAIYCLGWFSLIWVIFWFVVGFIVGFIEAGI